MEEWQNPQTIAPWIGIIVGLVLVLVVSLVLLLRSSFQRIMQEELAKSQAKINHQNALLETNIQAQENERRRIAADLHDELIGKLTVAKLKNLLAYNQTELDHVLEESIAIARRISHDLSPPMLDFTDINELITELIQPWKEKFYITYLADIRTTNSLSVQIKIQLTRIVQELLINCSKHAQASKVSILLKQNNNYIAMLFTDNGKGFDTTQQISGLGLKNIDLRICYLGGKYRLKSAQGKGTSIFLIITTNFDSQ